MIQRSNYIYWFPVLALVLAMCLKPLLLPLPESKDFCKCIGTYASKECVSVGALNEGGFQVESAPENDRSELSNVDSAEHRGLCSAAQLCFSDASLIGTEKIKSYLSDIGFSSAPYQVLQARAGLMSSPTPAVYLSVTLIQLRTVILIV